MLGWALKAATEMVLHFGMKTKVRCAEMRAKMTDKYWRRHVPLCA